MNKYVIILILIIIGIYTYFTQENFSSLEYANINDNWIEPQIFENFITKEDAKYIINYGEKNFETSKILSGIDKTIRNSKTTWLSKKDPVAKKIIKKVCSIVNMSYKNTEDLQIVKYKHGGFYNEHHDSCCDKDDACEEFIKMGGQRVVTFLIYLSDDFEEGGTFFPTLNKIYKPKKYGGILFYPLATNTNMCHPKALHTGLPIKSGTKYIANIWIREKLFI